LVFVEKLVLRNFKSFGPRKVTINFTKGFNAIVGPNGSGKSNVADALLFVLGNLSSKTLRAETFSGLIYDGPHGKPTSASVSLVFDNSNREMLIDADEVVIGRDVLSNGRGRYKLQGRTVTRWQIIDFLDTANIHLDGFNIVQQGLIAQLAQMDPLERRKIIERMAGIEAYDLKKEEALKELEQADFNLKQVETRIGDVLEIMERLKEEKEAALRYEEIGIRINEIEDLLLLGKLMLLEDSLADIDGEIDRCEEECSDISAHIDSDQEFLEELDSKIIEMEVRLSDKTEELNGLRDRGANVREVLSAEEVRLDHLNKSIKESDQRIKEIREGIKTVKMDLIKGEADLTFLKESYQSKTSEIESKEKEIADSSSSLEGLYKEISSKQKSLTDLANKRREMESDLVSLKSQVQAKRKELQLLEESLRTTTEEFGKKKETVDEIKLLVHETLKSLEEKAQELSLLEERLKTSERGTVEALTQDIKVLESEIQDQRAELIRAKTRLEAVKNLRSIFRRKKAAINAVLMLGDQQKIKGIYGTVAELCTTDPQFTVALQVAGGARLEYVVVEDDYTATECIKYLKERRIGRVSFLPLNRVQPKKVITASEVEGYDEMEGVIAPAISLVKFDEKFRKVIEFVFGGALIVESLEAGKKASKYCDRAVTLEGDVFYHSGLITGGHYQKKSATMPFSIDPEEIKELQEKLQSLEESKNKKEDKLELLLGTEKEQEAAAEKLKRDCERLRQSKTFEEEKLEKEKQEFEKFLLRIKELEKRVLEEEILLKQLTSEEEEKEKLVQEISEEEKVRLEELENSKALEQYQKLENLKTEAATLRSQLSEIEIKITERQLLVKQANKQNEDLQKTLSSLENEKTQLLADKEEKDKVVEKERERLQKISEEQEATKTVISEMKEEEKNLKKEIKKTERKLKHLEKTLSEKQSEIREHNVRKEHIEQKVEKLRKKVEKKDNLMKIKDSETIDTEKLENEISMLIQEKIDLEPINQLAVSQYEQFEKRYKELGEKRKKVLEEKGSILEFMRQLEEEKRQAFLKVFNEVNTHMRKIFALLSPGGEAYLVLQNPDDPFAGGVDINASPEGKKVKSPRAMSGGEKSLTTLSFMFAIQQVSPAPFYLLDEIDAFLDPANVQRVAELISDLSEKWQFIVVSLRDVMIARAKTLIGVYSREGISNTIRLNLEDLVKVLTSEGVELEELTDEQVAIAKR